MVVYSQSVRYILVHIGIGIGTYLIANKFFPEQLKPEPKSKLDVRGGDPTVSNRISLLVFKDTALKAGIITMVGSFMAREFHEEIIPILLKSSPAILADSGNKIRLSSEVKKLLGNPYLTAAKAVLLDKTLTKEDKLVFLKLKIRTGLKGLRGRKRLYFIMSILSLLVFLFGNNMPAFLFFWGNIREFFKSVDLDQYIVELYEKFNTTIPEELINQITQ